MSFLLSPLGIRIMAGLAIAALVMGLVWSHDHKVRKAEAAKWEIRLNECKTEAQAATDANAKLANEYRAFIAKTNKDKQDAADEQAKRLAERDKVLALLDKRTAKDQTEIDRLRALAAAGPQATKEEACAKADAILRALVADILRP